MSHVDMGTTECGLSSMDTERAGDGGEKYIIAAIGVTDGERLRKVRRRWVRIIFFLIMCTI